MKIYGFLYTTCTYESAAYPMSLHKTKAGAYKAMREFILRKYNRWHYDWLVYGGKRNGDLNKIGIHEAWFIKEFNLLK